MKTNCGGQVKERGPGGAEETGLAELVGEAATGDEQAWSALVDRFSGLVWSVTRAFRLSRDDAADVYQTTWLRFVEHLGHIREPERVGSWLATTTRRQCIVTLEKAGRAVPTEFEDSQLLAPDRTSELDAVLDAGQDRAALREAFDDLPERGRALLRVLSADPAPSYAEAAAVLDMPIGSIGPTRARCLERLRRSPQLVRLTADMGISLSA